MGLIDFKPRSVSPVGSYSTENLVEILMHLVKHLGLIVDVGEGILHRRLGSTLRKA